MAGRVRGVLMSLLLVGLATAGFEVAITEC
jgi:hypothetical protein